MSGNPLTSKIAAPYARALFDFSVEKNIMHQITADFQNLDIFLNEAPELLEYLNNPIVKQNVKSGILTKTLKSQLNTETFKFFGTGGGFYTAEKGIYTENIEFFSRNNNSVGRKLPFSYEVKDSDWYHKGKSSKGKPMHEIWTKRSNLILKK